MYFIRNRFFNFAFGHVTFTPHENEIGRGDQRDLIPSLFGVHNNLQIPAGTSRKRGDIFALWKFALHSFFIGEGDWMRLISPLNTCYDKNVAKLTLLVLHHNMIL